MILSMSFVGNATEIFVGDETSLPTIPSEDYPDRIVSRTFTTLQDPTSQVITPRIVQDNIQEILYTIQVFNNLGNNTQTYLLSATNFVGGSPNIVTATFNLTPGSQQAFGVLTTIDNEEFEIGFTCTDGCDNLTANGYKVISQQLQKREVRTISETADAFIDGALTLIEINISMWKLGFALFIFGIILSLIIGIFGFGFKLIEFAEKIRDAKKKKLHQTREE